MTTYRLPRQLPLRLRLKDQRRPRALKPRSTLLALFSCWLSWPSLALAAPQETFLATIKTRVGGSEECLVFGNQGESEHPERHSWQPGQPGCGLAGGDDALVHNGQAVFTFEHLGGDEYIISNAARGEDECLIFDDNGHAQYPSRYRWGAGPYCGFSGGIDELRANGQAVWKVNWLQGDRAMITNASRGQEECLMFGHNGQDRTPTRFNWGPESYCGLIGGANALLANGQAIFEIDRIRIDNHPVPPTWLDGYVILQNAELGQYRLHVGHNGNGVVYLEWGDDAAYRWQVQRVDSTSNFFFLTNGFYPHQRLHVGHNGNGQLYTGWGEDDAYLWALETAPTGYRFRNKKYPSQRLRADSSGAPIVRAGWGGDLLHAWTVQEVATLHAAADNSFTLSSLYENTLLRLDNARFPSQRLHAGHNSDGIVYTGPGDDIAYHWRFERATEVNTVYIVNRFFNPPQRLRVDPMGSTNLASTSVGPDDAFKWTLEPVGQGFYLTSKLQPHRRLTVTADGSGHPSAVAGVSGSEAQWKIRRLVDLPAWPGRRDANCSDFQDSNFRVCLFPGEDQTGEPWCQVHHGGFADYPFEVPREVALNAYSVDSWSCDASSAAPRLFVYDESGFKSDTEIVTGPSNLGTVGGKAHSYIVVRQGSSLGDRYVCLHKGAGGTGAKHCRPPMALHVRAQNLSEDFNDQIRSVRFNIDDWCSWVDLWEHYGGQGRKVTPTSNVDLAHGWENIVSSFRFNACP